MEHLTPYSYLSPPNELAEEENYKPVLENYRQKYNPN